MLKKYKSTWILTALVCILPMVVGLLLWNQLPDTIPTHWDGQGQVDGWSSKAFAVFGLPAILLGCHLICLFATCADPKHTNQHPAVMKLVLWCCPVISLACNSFCYVTALGYCWNVRILTPLLLGLLFLVIGNLLPKCRQSYTIGIKLPWTLDNEENWNKTHRFGGKVWVIGGVLTLATAFLGNVWLSMGICLVIAIVPCVYSYVLYRKQQKSGQPPKQNQDLGQKRNG